MRKVKLFQLSAKFQLRDAQMRIMGVNGLRRIYKNEGEKPIKRFKKSETRYKSSKLYYKIN